MTNDISDAQRRVVLQSAVGFAVAQIGLVAGAPTAPSVSSVDDFKFLTGNWKISNRRLKAPGDKEWDVFEGGATVWAMLGGMASIEELRA